MTTRSMSRDVALLTGVRLISVAAAFATNVLAARVLGPSALGAAGVAITVATIAALVGSGGLGLSAIYFLGRRPDRRTAIVATTAALSVAGLLVAALLVLASIPLVRAVFLPEHAPAVLLAAAVLAPAMVAADVGGATLLGLRSSAGYMLTEGLRAVGALLATAVVLAVGMRTDAGYVLAAALATWVAGSVAWVAIRRGLGALRPTLDRELAGPALRMGARGQAGNLLLFMSLRLDLLLVSAFLPVASVGIYLVAIRVAEVVIQVANAASALLFPHVAAQSERGDTAATERVTRVTLVLVIGVALVLGVLGEAFLAIGFGDTFAQGAAALRLSLVAMVPLALARVLSGDLKGRGRAGLVSVCNAVGVAVTLVAGLPLIPSAGIEGAALTSLLAYAAAAASLLTAYRGVTGARLLELAPGTGDLRLIWNLGRRMVGRGAAPAR